jgi:hypothetical protein
VIGSRLPARGFVLLVLALAWVAAAAGAAHASGPGAAATPLAFTDEIGHPLTLATSNLDRRNRGRTRAFAHLLAFETPAPPAPPAPVRADDFVDERLAAYATHGARADADEDMSFALVGTGLVARLSPAGPRRTLHRLLAEPEVAGLVARARDHREKLAFLLDYARTREGSPAQPAGDRPVARTRLFGPVEVAARVTVLAIRGARRGQQVYLDGLDPAAPAAERARLDSTLAYFRPHPSAGGHLHQAVQRWLIDTRRLERHVWWNGMNGHLFGQLGRTARWRAYQAWFAARSTGLRRERLYLAAHNEDLDTGLPLHRPHWKAMPWTERVNADAIMAAAIQGERILHLFPGR